MRVFLYLSLAAILEAGGDALTRFGLKGGPAWGVAAGAVVLAAYGVMVNLPDWDFSRLMGVYVCLFFLVTQLIAVVAFKERLSGMALVAGALILLGGAVFAVAKKN